MAEASIPVDLFNPGQVFACLGFLEAADVLLGDAEGGFDWLDPVNIRFTLRAAGEENPVRTVLEFLSTATPQRWGPVGYADPPPKKGKAKDEPDDEDGDVISATSVGGPRGEEELYLSDTFLAAEGDRMSLPIRFGGGNHPTVTIGHWADGSSRNNFKLYAGNRSAYSIASSMLLGVREKPKRNGSLGQLRAKGIRQLWEEDSDELTARPLHVLTPMGGSYNFDPRGAWTAIDAGYSPNNQDHQVSTSPVVEFLAAWGLENARPDEFETRKVKYAAWGISLPLMLARAALCGGITAVPLKHFRFALNMSGKNKVVTFAEMETSND